MGNCSGSGRGGGVSFTPQQQKAMDKLNFQLQKSKGETFTTPNFKIENNGNLSFEYTGTKTRMREKGGKMQSATKADTVEVTTKYYGTIFIGKDKMKIDRRSKTVSEKTLKRGRL